MSPFKETYFTKKLIANNEEMKVVINPTKSGRKGNVEIWLNADKNSTKAAKEIEGIPSKKEYFAASFFSHPDKRAIEIVAPDLDTPGIIAKAWKIPIQKLLRYVWVLKLINVLFDLSANSIIKDINIETEAIEKFDRKKESENPGTKILMVPPIKIIGIVAIKIDLYNL